MLKKIIYWVEWLDSRSPTSEWEFLDEFTSQKACRCNSVGFLLFENEDTLIISMSLGDIDGEYLQVAGILTIPKASIVRFTTLSY